MPSTRTGARVAINDGELERLGLVEDPLLRRPLAELGMIRSVRSGRRGTSVEIALPVADYPCLDELRGRLDAAAGAEDGRARTVSVTTSSMTPTERHALGEHLRVSTPGIVGDGLRRGCRTFAVASGKGGVGKSTVTANLAAALAAGGRRVGVLDADVWGHSIPHMFGAAGNPLTLGPVMLPVSAHGVALMSVGFFVAPDDPVVWRGPMLHKALEQFLGDTYWGEIDTLLIDLPPGTGDISLSLLELVPDAALLAVTTPGATASSVAQRVVRMAVDQRMPIAGVVENMSAAICDCCGHRSPVFGEGGGRMLAEMAGAPLLGQVPLDAGARSAGDTGLPVVLGSPDSPAATALREVADSLPTTRRSLLGRGLPLAVR